MFYTNIQSYDSYNYKLLDTNKIITLAFDYL